MPTMQEPLTVTVAEAARLLGFKDRRTIYGLIHTGRLKARKANRSYMVNYASLKRFAGSEGVNANA